MEEIWKDVKGYEGLYQVSNLGKVKSVERYVTHYKGGVKLVPERILKQYIPNTGYPVVHISKKNISINIQVHRLVAEAFISNPDNKPEVDHINTDRTDNRVENLRWVTSKENQNNPLTRINKSESKKGEKAPWYGKYGKEHPNSKPVLQFDNDSNFIREWECVMQVYKELGIDFSNLLKCCNGKRKTAGGYVWKFKN